MLFIAQDRKKSYHSFTPKVSGEVERSVSSGQTSPLSFQRYHESVSSPASRKALPKPSSLGLSLHDLFAAGVGTLLIGPVAWAGADLQATEHLGPANSAPPAATSIHKDAQVAAEPAAESILLENQNPNASSQAIVLQWTGPNGEQWVVPLSLDGVTSVPMIKISKSLAMIGADHADDGFKSATPFDNNLNTIAASNISTKPALSSIDSDNEEKKQPKL